MISNIYQVLKNGLLILAILGLVAFAPAAMAQAGTEKPSTPSAKELQSDSNTPQKTLENYQLALKEAMDKIFGVLEDLEKRTDLTPAEKQRRAIEFLRIVRYGPEQKDYFWIHDLQGKMIMDPYIPDLVGKDLSDFVDANGVEVFAEAIKLSRSVGQGYFDYLWPKYEGKQAVPKVALVRLYGPWGWVIGTGIYRDTIEAYELPESVSFSVPLTTDPFVNDRDRVSRF